LIFVDVNGPLKEESHPLFREFLSVCFIWATIVDRYFPLICLTMAMIRQLSSSVDVKWCAS